MKAADGVQIAERWAQIYGILSANDDAMDAHFCTCIAELSRAEERERVLREALRDVVDGNDHAHARKLTLESWPTSTFRKNALAALTAAPEQGKEAKS